MQVIFIWRNDSIWIWRSLFLCRNSANAMFGRTCFCKFMLSTVCTKTWHSIQSINYRNSSNRSMQLELSLLGRCKSPWSCGKGIWLQFHSDGESRIPLPLFETELTLVRLFLRRTSVSKIYCPRISLRRFVWRVLIVFFSLNNEYLCINFLPLHCNSWILLKETIFPRTLPLLMRGGGDGGRWINRKGRRNIKEKIITWKLVRITEFTNFESLRES